MNSDLANVFLLSFVAMANPTLLAATTAMLLLPNPKKLMLGYCSARTHEHHARPADRVLAAWLERGENLEANDQPR